MNVDVKYEHDDSLFDDSLDWPLKPELTEERLKAGKNPIKVGISPETGKVYMNNYTLLSVFPNNSYS